MSGYMPSDVLMLLLLLLLLLIIIDLAPFLLTRIIIQCDTKINPFTITHT